MNKLLFCLLCLPLFFFWSGSAVAVAPYPMRVLVLSYFPLTGDRLDVTETGIDLPLSQMRQTVQQQTSQVAQVLTEGSRYHHLRDSAAAPSLQYTIVRSLERLEKVPRSTNHIPWNPPILRPDYMQMLTSAQICNAVETEGINEVWIWSYHYGDVEPVESDMAGPYGDVSNSERIADLPVCQKTYVLYNYNYGRDSASAVHDHIHQIEAVMGQLDTSLFWDTFVRPYGNSGATNHCGWAHMPPNTAVDYQYNSQTVMNTDCNDWRPDGSGTVSPISCTTWGCTELGYFQWWLQSVPGYNNGLTVGNKRLRNWWDAIGDFDGVMQHNPSLYELPGTLPPTVTPTRSPTPSSVPSATPRPSTTPIPTLTLRPTATASPTVAPPSLTPVPACTPLTGADCNCDGQITLSDSAYWRDSFFAGQAKMTAFELWRRAFH